MNPNQPDQGQPGQAQVPPMQPAVPADPASVPQSVQPMAGPVDPAALQAALDEPVGTADPAQLATTEQPVPETGGEDAGIEQEGADDDAFVTWTAHESIHHEKGAIWFVLFTVLMAGLLGLSVWTQAWSFAILIVVITVVVFIYSKRPPRELSYSLNDDGLTVDGRLRRFDEFKSFGVIQDGDATSVMLIPMQRLQPGLTVYFPEELGEDIVDILGTHLSMKELHLDAVDRMARFFRL